MSSLNLGTLARLDAREVWKNEAYDFTPWLRAHIDVLGQGYPSDPTDSEAIPLAPRASGSP